MGLRLSGSGSPMVFGGDVGLSVLPKMSLQMPEVFPSDLIFIALSTPFFLDF